MVRVITKDLKKKLGVARRALGSEGIYSDCIFLETRGDKILLQATDNLNVRLWAWVGAGPIEKEFKLVVPVDPLYSFLGKEEATELEVSDNTLTVTCGGMKGQLAGVPSNQWGYLDLPNPAREVEGLERALSLTYSVAAKDSTQRNANGVSLGPNYAMGTDTYRVVRVAGGFPLKREIVIPREGCEMISKISSDPMLIGPSEGGGGLVVGSGDYTLQVQLIPLPGIGELVTSSGVLDWKASSSVVVPRGDLLRALEKASVLSDEVRLEGGLVVSSKGMHGTFEHELEGEGALEEVWFHVGNLMEAIEVGGSRVRVEVGENEAGTMMGRVSNKNVTHVVVAKVEV